MSRLENSIDKKDLYRIGKQLVDTFIDSYAREPEVIIHLCTRPAVEERPGVKKSWANFATETENRDIKDEK